MAVVSNREPRIYTVSHNVHVGKDAHGHDRIMPKRVILRPGVNNIRDADWALVRENPGLKRRIRSGMLEVLAEREDPTEAPSRPKDISEDEAHHLDELEEEESAQVLRETLAMMTVREAAALIRETIDVEVLEAWAEAERAGQARKGIADAIETQLAKVTKKSTDKDS